MTELQWIDIFGDNLRDMLHEAGMTQQELADATGVAKSTISKYINKQTMPSVKAIVNIYHVLSRELVRCDINDLLYFEDRMI